MQNIFDIDQSDLKKLSRFFRESPKLLKPAAAGVLNNLAFDLKKIEEKNLLANLVIRNRRFMESSIQVQKARGSGDIQNMVAIVGSVRRDRFTGWEEQEKGTMPKRHRTDTLIARGGNKKGTIKSYARFRKSGAFYKPEQFAGRNLKQSFGFMMRVLNTRGTSQFMITTPINTRKGQLGKGLYQLKNHKINRLRDLKKTEHIKPFKWTSLSINQLKYSTNAFKVWERTLNHLTQRFK